MLCVTVRQDWQFCAGHHPLTRSLANGLTTVIWATCLWAAFLSAAVTMSAAEVTAAEPATVVAPGSEKFPLNLQDGDRVVFLGGTLTERDGQFGDLETAIMLAAPGKHVTFRNLGWSGDTVWADSRGVFDPPAVGYQRLIALVKELSPSVVVLMYGQNEAHAGPARLAAFQQQYRKLCEDLQQAGPTKLVFALPPLIHRPEAAYQAWNQQLQTYRGAIAELATSPEFVKSRSEFIDLDWNPNPARMADYYEGPHLTPQGSDAWALELAQTWGTPMSGNSAEVRHRLRAEVVAKNTLFFHRWRPQNSTYLFGFRKHEQGNNAVDIPKFDELTRAADQQLAVLKSKLLQH